MKQNINDRVIAWLFEKTGLNANELPSNDQRIRKNTDGTILVNLKWLENQNLDKAYFEFLESNKIHSGK